MNKLVDGLKKHEFQALPLTKKRDFIENSAPECLKDIIEKDILEQLNQAREIFHKLGLKTEDMPIGFQLKMADHRFQFGIEPKLYEKEKYLDEHVTLFFHYGVPADALSVECNGLFPKEIYASDLEKSKSVLFQFLLKEENKINRKMEEIVRFTYLYFSRMIVDEKNTMTLPGYLEMASLFENKKNMPIISLVISNETVETYYKILNDLEEPLLMKVKIGLVPTLLEHWKRENQWFNKMKGTKSLEALDKFLKNHYNDEMLEVIKGKKKHKSMLKVYGLLWKEKFKKNPLCQEIEEFILTVKKNENKFSVYLNDVEKLQLIDNFQIGRFNPTFHHFGLEKHNEKVSIHMYSFLTGYYLENKDANIVEAGFQLMVYEKDTRNLFDKDQKYFETIPTDETVQHWMETLKIRLDWLLE